MSPSKRIRPILRKALTAEEEAAAAQLRLLAQMRREVLAALADATDYGVWHLTAILRAIDAEVSRLSAQASADIANATRDIYTLGVSMVDAALGEPSVQFAGLGTNLVQAAVELGQEHITGIWDELGNGLKAAIRRVTFGITDPNQAIAQVAQLIRNPKTFGTAQARAEVIVRTETNRTFSLASYTRMQQSAKVLGDKLHKGWLSAGDDRVRDEHQDAADTYSAESGGIPVDQPFIVGGEEEGSRRGPRRRAEMERLGGDGKRRAPGQGGPAAARRRIHRGRDGQMASRRAAHRRHLVCRLAFQGAPPGFQRLGGRYTGGRKRCRPAIRRRISPLAAARGV